MPKPTSDRRNRQYKEKKKRIKKEKILYAFNIYLPPFTVNSPPWDVGSPACGPGFTALSARGFTGPPQGPCGCSGMWIFGGFRTSFGCLDLKIWM